jgi:hypothetical protein
VYRDNLLLARLLLPIIVLLIDGDDMKPQGLRDSVIIVMLTCLLMAFTELALQIYFPASPLISRVPSEEQTAFEFNPDYLVALKAN